MTQTRETKIRLSVAEKGRVERALREVGEVGNRAMLLIEEGAKPASKQLRAVQGAADELRGGLDGLAAQGGAAGRVLAGLGPAGLAAAAGIGAVAAAATIARGAAQEFSETARAAEELGVGLEVLQEVRGLALLSTGLGADRADEGFATFLERISEARAGTGDAAESFRRLGVSVTDAEGRLRDGRAVLLDVAEALSGLRSGAERLELRRILFGDEDGKAFAGLDRGREAVEALIDESRRLGLVIDEDLIRKGAEAQREFEVFARIIDLNLKQAFVSLAPFIADVAGLVSSVAIAINDASTAVGDFLAKTPRGSLGLLETYRPDRDKGFFLEERRKQLESERGELEDEIRLLELTARSGGGYYFGRAAEKAGEEIAAVKASIAAVNDEIANLDTQIKDFRAAAEEPIEIPVAVAPPTAEEYARIRKPIEDVFRQIEAQRLAILDPEAGLEAEARARLSGLPGFVEGDVARYVAGQKSSADAREKAAQAARDEAQAARDAAKEDRERLKTAEALAALRADAVRAQSAADAVAGLVGGGDLSALKAAREAIEDARRAAARAAAADDAVARLGARATDAQIQSARELARLKADAVERERRIVETLDQQIRRAEALATLNRRADAARAAAGLESAFAPQIAAAADAEALQGVTRALEEARREQERRARLAAEIAAASEDEHAAIRATAEAERAAEESARRLRDLTQERTRELERQARLAALDRRESAALGAASRAGAALSGLSGAASSEALGRVREDLEAAERSEARRLAIVEAMIGRRGEEAERIRAVMAAEFAAEDATRGMRAALDAQLDAVKEQEAAAKRLGDAFSGAFESAVFGAKSAGDAVRDLALEISKMLFRQNVSKPLSDGISGLVSGGGFLSSLFTPQADGGAWLGGRQIDYYANGGVVDAPTFFGTASGGLGVMGEAGAEAILPLRRGADGKLGVAAAGGGANITVNIAARDAESFRRSRTQVAADIARAISFGRRGV